MRRLAVVTHKGQIDRSSSVQNGTVIIGGPSVEVGATVIAHQAANVSKGVLNGIISVIGDGIRDVNYKLTFQYGNKEIKLAGGMTEKTQFIYSTV
ncbi:hypothetical protein [Spirosoma sp.]|uniref:hypothetical protein n=1 Tax=Spirosoma sp. TaxID=1899569 RepID=UPI003B3BDA35